MYSRLGAKSYFTRMTFKANVVLINRYKAFFGVLFLTFLTATVVICLLSAGARGRAGRVPQRVSLEWPDAAPEARVRADAPTTPTRANATYFDSFDVYRCGREGADSLLVYVYPLRKHVDERSIPLGGRMSREYHEVLRTVVDSHYYTPDPDKACVFVPSIDTLNQNRFRVHETSQALAGLSHWSGGANHLVFNMVPGVGPDFSTMVELSLGQAMVAGAGFSSLTYRPGFDVSLPVFSPLASRLPRNTPPAHSRPWLLVSAQLDLYTEHAHELRDAARRDPGLVLLGPCSGRLEGNRSVRCLGDSIYHYPQLLQRGKFCAVVRGGRLAQPALHEAMAAGCVPVVVADMLVMPFQEVIDWKRRRQCARRAALFVLEENLGALLDVVRGVSEERLGEMQAQVRWLYSRYFSSVKAVTLTALEILADRVFPRLHRVYEHWNLPPNPKAAASPLFLQLTAPRAQGFTAVVLTYDRVDSLFTLVQKLVRAPSLNKVLVVWNNQRKSPPHPSMWPKINKPLKVIQTKENKLSNRFYPYEEIETEAILTIDDDIVMLTADELEFGYEVWREFPDRIVGFPSRTHVWDNVTQHWKYESEWTNQISMVLTGAAFHHKYWSYLYTTAMPGNIKEWVDEHMNCEDIAMNFLVANVTRKAPIKVTPRKKFKCPECTNTEMLSADLNHMMERSQCIDRFAAIYGSMPLQTVEFRADPVLYKDTFPEKLKRFNDIGSL
ncbi:exostosin-2 isoform X2 [Bacillus rossius redtenbacheri]|uniref:exostosin-2 isoform X2 n=1 Tax=Bacillus rossius redtenbacheri TaxID=93214 RepID=UPI002FDE7A02